MSWQKMFEIKRAENTKLIRHHTYWQLILFDSVGSRRNMNVTPLKCIHNADNNDSACSELYNLNE